MLPSIGSLIRTQGNSELGPGRVLAYRDGGLLEVGLLWKGTRRIFNPRQATTERYMLFGCVPVAVAQSESEVPRCGIILGAVDDPDDGLWTYSVAFRTENDWETSSVSEAHVSPLPADSADPTEQFKTLSWGGPTRFLRRWALRGCQSRWLQDSGGIPAFLGARIRPMGHQLYAARRVLWDRTPRFILADEVGLGKTIEAGLVIQSLMTDKPDLRVLVITPGSMARQWQTELYLRFGALAYAYIDSTTPEFGQKVRGSRCLVITTTALQTSPEAGEHLVAKDWDLLIVDEAHQFPPGSELYDLYLQLAKRTSAVLALSATPSKRELTSLAGLLALVAPGVYEPSDHATLNARLEGQRDVWDRLTFTRKALDAAERSGEVLDTEDLAYLAKQWEDLVPGDSNIQCFLRGLDGGDITSADRLVAYVQEFHRLDHRIIRTRRSTIEGGRQCWSERTVEMLRYEGSTSEAVLANHVAELPDVESPSETQQLLRGLYFRLSASTPRHLTTFLRRRRDVLARGIYESPLDHPLRLVSADPGPADEALLIERVIRTTPTFPGEAQWLVVALGLAEDWAEEADTTERSRTTVRWMTQHLRQDPSNQVLVFAQDREVVIELAAALDETLAGFPVQSFHHGMKEAELSKVALQFQRNQSCRVLVSDELGGEGRNFQNASAVLHYDVPWSVARLEQRIGRLDRVGRGRDRPVQSVVLQGPLDIENALVGIHNDVFKVFTRSVGGLEYALPRLQRDLNRAICAGAHRVKAIAGKIAVEIEVELQDVDEAFELALDASKYQLADAQEVADIVAESEDSRYEIIKFAQWARDLGIGTRQRPDNSWEFSWDREALSRSVPGLQANGFISGTFDRETALADESFQFFAAGHPFITALVADLEASAEGRATVMTAKLGAQLKGKLFMLLVGHCHLDESMLVDVTSSPGLRLRAHRYLPPEVWTTMVEIMPGKEPAAIPLQDALVLAQFRSPERIEAKLNKVPPNILGQGIDLTDLWGAVDDGMSLAIEDIRRQREGIPEEALKRFESDIGPELGFLEWQRKRVDMQTRRVIEAEIRARQGYIEALRNEQIDVEAIAVIVAIA